MDRKSPIYGGFRGQCRISSTFPKRFYPAASVLFDRLSTSPSNPFLYHHPIASPIADRSPDKLRRDFNLF
ncbi:hypothetical protein [Leptolyngbya ohadii]|uniref:hypothetical protein n=1 Tax=Leptolyngbya ohadii TaxID=1962290 RepID=UPI00117AC953|nr:hypothetical protein [Leptolyngbya ohadii]